jgi:hypothetical protein
MNDSESVLLSKCDDTKCWFNFENGISDKNDIMLFMIFISLRK